MAQPPSARPVIAKPVVVAAASSSTTATNGEALERQLDALLKPTTVEDLARRGGQIKTMRERDLRELIRQSILTLIQSSTSLASIDQEQLLDQVQGELKRTLAAKASERAEQEALHAELTALTERVARKESELAEASAENDVLRGQLTDAEQETATLRAELEAAHSKAGVSGELDAWAHEIDVQWFAGRHQRQRVAGASLLESLAGHLAACQQLLADYPATPPGVDAAGDVIARTKTLLALRKQDQGWIGELQKRQGAMLEEREKLRNELETGRMALDEELARSIDAEAQAEQLAEQVTALQQRIDDLEARPTETAPAAVWNEELAELRERIAESQSHLEDASAARIRAERELATTATGRATAERRLADSENRVTELTALLQTLEAQVTDQRKTTDIARLASVEAEALRAEIEGLKVLLREREAVLADERARAQAGRERHRADNANRLEAMRRVELALVQLKDQLAAAERLLAERDAERAVLVADLEQVRSRPASVSAAPIVPDRSDEIAALAEALAAARTRAHEAEQRARLEAAEVAGLRAHQADAVQLSAERDLLRQALAEAEQRAAERPTSAGSALPDAALDHHLTTIRRELLDVAAAREVAESARRLAEAEVAGLRAHQADAVALQRERDWLRQALLAFAPTQRAVVPTEAVTAPAPLPPATQTMASAAPEPVAPPATPPLTSTPATSAPAVPTIRRGAPAVLGSDGRARISYLSSSTPRMLVHGTTWHHSGLSATAAAADARPLLLATDDGVSVLYRDRQGAILRATSDVRETVLPIGSADGEPAVLPEREHWLLAVRRGDQVHVRAQTKGIWTELGAVPAAGDPAFIPGTKHAPARLAIPAADGGVTLHALSPGLPLDTTLRFTPSACVNLAVAGAGNDAVLAVRDAAGVISARHALRSGDWGEPVILDAAGAPAVGRLAAAAHDGEIVVAYRASDGLLQLMLHRGAWRHLAFGSNFKAPAPAAAADPALILHDRLIRCFYQGVDGHLHEVRNSIAGWNAYDLSVLSGDF